MQIIPMEDFVLQEKENATVSSFDEGNRDSVFKAMKAAQKFNKRAIAYANFLKTPMRKEHFEGRAAVVKIDGYQVLQPVDGKTNKDLTNVGLLLMNDDDNPIALAPNSTFRVLAGFPCAKLTEHGVKLIFG